MRTLYKLVCLFGLFAFFSCDAYLDVEQPSIYTDQNYYKTPDDFETAITGVYAQLQKIYNRGYLEVIVMRGDEVKNSSNIGRFLDTSLESGWSNAWKSWWVLVNRSNKILDRIDAVNFVDEKQKEYIIGEAYALRGLAYLQFAWCWGGSPLIVHDLELSELRKVVRSTQEETYGQAISDFEKAFEMLPESWSGDKTGRVTRYAAAGMLGRTYLYMHDYAKAAEWLEKVVAQDNKLYKLATNYIDCFDDAYNNSKERVWEVQFVGGTAGKTLGISQKFSGWFIASKLDLKHDGPLLYGITFLGGSGSIGASQSLSGEGVYEENDSRREATIINGLYYDKSAPVLDQYSIRKFLKTTKTIPTATDEFGNNIPILRYTDVKMMYAEALNELDHDAYLEEKILPIINEVRTRAKLTPKTAEDFPDKQTTFDYLVRDRFVEFCYEGIRWPDLIRWGLAKEAMEKHFKLTDEGYDVTNERPKYVMNDHNVLAPIPQSEIFNYNNTAVMWQNPGY